MSHPDPALPTDDDWKQLADDVIAALREEGLPGNIAYDDEGRRLLNEAMQPLYLAEVWAQHHLVEAEERTALVQRWARAHLRGRQPPETWQDAEERVFLHVRPQMNHVIWSLRKELEGLTVPPVPSGALTDDLVVEFAWSLEDGIATAWKEDLARWEQDLVAIQERAAQNLLEATVGTDGWQTNPDLEGVYRSRWRDHFDASRILLGGDLGLPLEGTPVALATDDSCLYVADGSNEQALFNLGLAVRREVERTKRFVWLRALWLEGERPVHKLPDPSSAAYAPLKLLWCMNDKADYDQHGQLLQRLFARDSAPVRVAPLELVQDPDGVTHTVAVWEGDMAVALPHAEAVVFRREGENIAGAPFERVQEVMGEVLEEKPGYPQRYLAHMFPQEWQLEQLNIPGA